MDVILISINYEGFFDCFRSIVMEEGVFGLYRGFGVFNFCLVRKVVKFCVLMVIKIILFIYEFLIS